MLKIKMSMAESLCCPPEAITILLIGYTPIQNKKLKNKYNRDAMPSLLGCQCWFSSDASRTPFLGAKPMVTCCAHAGLVFSFSVFFGGGILGESLPDLFHVHCSDKTQNCAENHASWEQFLRVI